MFGTFSTGYPSVLDQQLCTDIVWYSPTYSVLYPCAWIKCRNHCISGMNISPVISSASVELLVFILTFLKLLDTDPFPIENNAPPCPLQSQCTLWDPPTYHFRIPRFLMLNLNFKYLVPFRYFSTCFNLPQSSLSGFFTLVVRNATAVCISCLAHVDINSSCATRRWKARVCSSSSTHTSPSSLTLNK